MEQSLTVSRGRLAVAGRLALLLSILVLFIALTAQVSGESAAQFPAWQEPRLVKNILSKTGDSLVYPVAEMNGLLFFGASGLGIEQNWSELWRTDGTPGGTILLERRADGTSFSPSFVLGDKLLFLAPHPDYGTELWISDGTPGDAHVMGDAFPEPEYPFDGQVANHTVSGDYLYFTAYDDVNLTELWRTDGTLAGTIRLTGEDLGLEVGMPNGLIDVNGTLFFLGQTAANKPLLLKSNGTVAGTTIFKEGDGMDFSGPMHVANGLLYTIGHDIWRSDGTAAGTYKIYTFPDDSGIPERGSVSAATKVYFVVEDSSKELWQSSGTTATTTKVVDLPDFNGYMATVGNRLFFTGYDQLHGNELWTSDGTAAGTKMVKDIWPGDGNSAVDHMVVAGDYVYFQADDPNQNDALWRSDGTAAGTTKVPLPGASADGDYDLAKPLAPYGNELFFQGADVNHGREPWMTTGSGTSSNFLKDINLVDSLSSMPGGFNVANDTLFFWTTAGLWKSDGSEAGTSLLVNNIKQHRMVRPYPSGISANNLYFLIDDYQSSDIELWRTNGTAGGTVLVRDAIAPMYRDDPVYSMADVNGTLYFARFAKERSRKELWRTDGTAAGAVHIFTPNPTFEQSSEIDEITGVGNIAYFVATNGINGVELWRSDGTAAGTAMVKDIKLGAGGSTPSKLTAIGSRLLFVADDGIHGRELWHSDGTAAGTVMVKDIRLGSASSDPSELTFFNGLVYFTADNGTHGRELWRSDGTAAGTTMVKDILPAGSSNPRQLITGDDWLYFFAGDGAGLNPYKSDGTGAGTSRLAVIQYNDFELPESLTAVGNMIFFTVGSTPYQDTLYQSDGTAAGTIAQDEAYPDFQAYDIKHLTAGPGRLYFSANHLMHGNEPFVKDLSLAINSPSTLYLPEGSSYSYFQLSLRTKPTMPMTVHFAADDPTVEIVPSMVTITPQNWNVPASIGVRAADDGQPGVREATITQTFESADSAIDGLVLELPLRIGWKFGYVPLVVR